MTQVAGAGNLIPRDDDSLELLVEEFTNRLQQGIAPDVESFARAHPAHADRLRRLLQALNALADLGRPSTTAFAPGPPEPAVVPGEGVLGDFRILREVARGGMGIVYEAVQ